MQRCVVHGVAALLAGTLVALRALSARLHCALYLLRSSPTALVAAAHLHQHGRPTLQAPPVTALILWLVSCWWQAEQFSYCQPWMLAWGYRKQNLLKELLAYHADILCLQARRLLTCAPAAEHAAHCMECAAPGRPEGGMHGAIWLQVGVSGASLLSCRGPESCCRPSRTGLLHTCTLKAFLLLTRRVEGRRRCRATTLRSSWRRSCRSMGTRPSTRRRRPRSTPGPRMPSTAAPRSSAGTASRW